MWAQRQCPSRIDNTLYDKFGELWYSEDTHPNALLRAQAVPLVDWVSTSLADGARPARVLDVGCGAGLLSNRLVQRGFHVTGLDASSASLAVAERYDVGHRVRYVQGDARSLPFPDESFEAVTAMDMLEHVDRPEDVIREAARVLVPGGQLLFHTFNRTLLAWLVVIKGVEWFVANTPPRMHVLELFIKPAELEHICRQHGLVFEQLSGFGPVVASPAFFKLLVTRRVPVDLRFELQRSTRTSYIGIARKRGRDKVSGNRELGPARER